MGNCANAFGVCCVVSTSTCGSTVGQNMSYIQNPGFPATFMPMQATNCAFNIAPLNSAICQLRLDLLRFQISNKQADGSCMGNTLTINGPTARDPPILCGTLTGQHSKF